MPLDQQHLAVHGIICGRQTSLSQGGIDGQKTGFNLLALLVDGLLLAVDFRLGGLQLSPAILQLLFGRRQLILPRFIVLAT